MFWNRLKKMQCPKCNAFLEQEEDSSFSCKDVCCSFAISKQKFDAVVTDLYKPKFERKEINNLEELNNL